MYNDQERIIDENDASRRNSKTNSSFSLPQTFAAEEAPKDHYNAALIILCMIGFGSLLPFNVFITASGYFSYKFRDLADDTKTSFMQKVYESCAEIANPAVGLIISLLNTYLTKKISFQKRIGFSLLAMALFYALCAGVSQTNTDSWQGGYFGFIILSLCFSSMTGSIVGSSAIGISSCMPAAYTSSCIFGIAISGCFATTINIISILVADGNQDTVGLAYFILAALAGFITIILFWVFCHLPFTKYYVAQKESAESAYNDFVENSASSEVKNFGGVKRRLLEMKEVMADVWCYGGSIVLTYFCTLSLFPSVMSKIESTDNDDTLWTNSLFVPLVVFLIYNVGDACGRYSHGFAELPALKEKTGYYAIGLSLLRFGFIPLILFCNVQPRSHLGVAFGDVPLIFFNTVLAFSNGYLTNLCCSYSPRLVPPHLQETTGSMMISLTYVGLLSGGLFSLVMVFVP